MAIFKAGMRKEIETRENVRYLSKLKEHKKLEVKKFNLKLFMPNQNNYFAAGAETNLTIARQ